MDHGYAVKTVEASTGLGELIGEEAKEDLPVKLQSEEVQKELLTAIAADCVTKRAGGKL